ncbi:cell division FtsA domain-containing protein, partial [bacterium]|nr:cell division FtsA domain-containing protein [bacterium]
EAEKKKIKSGIKTGNKKVNQALEKKIKKLIREINEVLDYSKEKHRISVNKIILTGESSKMKGFLDLIKEGVKIKVEIGKIFLSDKNIPLEYSGAIGLALGSLESKYSKDLKIPLINKKNRRRNFLEDFDRKEHCQNNVSVKKRVFLLLVVLMLGFFIIFGIYYFREKNNENNSYVNYIEEYKNRHVLDLSLTLNTGSYNYNENYVRARLIEVVMDNLKYKDSYKMKKGAIDLANLRKNQENRYGLIQLTWSLQLVLRRLFLVFCFIQMKN